MFEKFLQQLAQYCQKNDLKLAFAKPYDLAQADWENLADIDLIADDKDLPAVIAYIKKSFPDRYLMQWDRTDGKTILLYFVAQDQPVFLKLDFITEFSIRGLPYMNMNSVLLRTEERLQVMPRFMMLQDQLLHLWALQRVKHRQPDLGRYHFLLQDFVDAKKDDFLLLFESAIGNENALNELDHINGTAEQKNLLLKYTLHAVKKDPFLSFWHLTKYYFLCLWQTMQMPNMIVAFYGIDGSGKTYLVNALKPWLRLTSLDVRHCHFFPLLPWQKEPNSNITVKNPHAHPLRSSVTSVGKLFYYAFKMWLAKMIPVRRPTVHLCDRYALDLLVDPVRFRLGCAAQTIFKMLRIFPPADINFLVYSDAKIAHARKSELSVEVLHKQNQNYSFLLKNMPQTVFLDQEDVRIAKAKEVLLGLLKRCVQ